MVHSQISIEDMYGLTKQEDKLMILDVRSEEEFEHVRIPNSYCIPLPVLTSEKLRRLMQKEGFNDNDPIYVSCKVGPRAVAACEKLETEFDNVYHLVGCMTSWLDEGLPTESGELDD